MEQVSVESVIKAFKGNIEKAIQLIIASVPKIAGKNWDTEIKDIQVSCIIWAIHIFMYNCTISPVAYYIHTYLYIPVHTYTYTLPLGLFMAH